MTTEQERVAEWVKTSRQAAIDNPSRTAQQHFILSMRDMKAAGYSLPWQIRTAVQRALVID